ncbi:hinge connector of long tail fiber distal connector [Aeromonas phage Aswh_1]|nr:hinge connector of long tail fiber distal connector [Aeromonas phage Aswh_1]
MADLKSSSTAGGGLVWTQTNLPFSPQDIKLFYDGKEIIDNTNNQTIGGNKNFTGTLTYKTPSSSNEVAIKSYVDGLNSTSVKSVNGTLPIVVTTGVNPTVSINNATQSAHGAMSKEDKVKLDGLPVRAVNRDGDTMTGNLGLVNLTATGMVTATTGLINADADYGQRMVLSGSTGYFQSGKKDRNLDDQRMMFSGYLGVPLSYSATMMKDGVNPIVRWGSASYDILHRGNLPSAEDIKAMAVYDRPTGDDCNNATMPGNYGIFANTANTPFGSGPSGSTLLVTKWGNGANAQIFFSYTSDRVFIRRQYIGVWQAWTEVYTSANKQPVGGMGLGVGDSPNAITVTGGVRDFNLVKTTGVFTVDGNWSNGVDNSPTASSHTGMVEVKQRAFDNMTIQTFYYHINVADTTTQRAYTRIWQNASTGWSAWIPTGVWEQVNTYRTGILRHNNATNDDSVYPYVSYTKEKYRDGVAAGIGYVIGEIGFRAGSANRYDPHSGDQLARILGQAYNTTTTGQYEGGLFLASRYRNTDGTVGDTSTFLLSRSVGAELTHAGKKVQINTGVVSAEKYISNSSGYALQYANNSQQGIYFDNRTIIGGSSVGTDGVIIRPNGSGTITGETVFNANGTISNNQAPTLAMHLTNKAYVDSVALGGFSSIIGLKDADNLNDIKTAGIYSQTANVKALTSLNYPVQKAGNLIVTTSAGVIQKYWVYNSSEVWSRAQYSTGDWKPWYRDYNEEFKPTSADVGALSLTGGTVTGDVRFNSGNTTRLSLGGGSDYYVERSPSGLTLASGTINPKVRVDNTDYDIYHVGNKPSLTELGLQYTIPSAGGTPIYVRLATVGSTDSSISFSIYGLGDFGQAKRATYDVNVSTRSDGIIVAVNSLDVDALYNQKPKFYYRKVGSLFEVWLKTPNYNATSTLTRLDGSSNNIKVDSVTQTEPTGLTEVTINQIYTTRFAPTANAVGALPITGGTVTGQLGLSATYNGSSVNAQIAHIGSDASQSLFIRNMREHNTATWIWEKVYSGSLYYSTGINGGGQAKIRMNVTGSGDIYLGNADKRVYHEGYETTPAKIGAYTKAETDSLLGSAGRKTVEVSKPSGITANHYVPVVLTSLKNREHVYINTRSSGGTDPMNNCSFNGIVRSGGWGDGGSYVTGQFTIFHTSERALHSVYGGTEGDGFVAFYVHEKAFPITVIVDGDVGVATAASVSAGTSIFTASADPATGNTKATMLAQWADGGGFYQGSSRTPSFQTMNTELDKKLDKTGGTVTGNLSVNTQLTVGNSVICGGVTSDSWLRTNGDNGWYSEKWGGGIHMSDAQWIRTYGGKKLHVANPDGNAINTDGGINAAKGLTLGGGAVVGGSINVTGGYMSLTSSNNTLLEFHTPGVSAAMIYKGPEGNLRFVTSNGSGGETLLRMQIDTGGNVVTSGSINSSGYLLEAGQRVYSPNNQVPDGVIMRAVTNAGGNMAVGSYAMITVKANLGPLGPGTVLQGTQIQFSNAEGTNFVACNYGQWRLMGVSRAQSQNSDGWGSWNVTLAQRIT